MPEVSGPVILQCIQRQFADLASRPAVRLRLERERPLLTRRMKPTLRADVRTGHGIATALRRMSSFGQSQTSHGESAALDATCSCALAWKCRGCCGSKLPCQ
eukprot:1079524-Rhodomonas_salina.1